MPAMPSRKTSIIVASSLVFGISAATAALATPDDKPAPAQVVATASATPSRTLNGYEIARLAAKEESTSQVAPGVTVKGDKVVKDASKEKANKVALSKAFGDGKGNYKYGQPLPCGPNANFTPYWWGMEFHLSPEAAQKLVIFLEKTQKIADIVAFLSTIGVAVAPEAAVIIATVLKVIAVVAAHVRNQITENGLLINFLWLPIPWAAKPTKPFVPADGSRPTDGPTVSPTVDPTVNPTVDPTVNPTVEPTTDPTVEPTVDPTDPAPNPNDPTDEPTVDPTDPDVPAPTELPTASPTEQRNRSNR